MSTGGGGDRFEKLVAAYYLADLLLSRAPLGADSPVGRVVFQRRNQGAYYDDVVVTTESAPPITFDVQVKRSLRFIASQKASSDVLSAGIESLRVNDDEHNCGRRRLVVATTPAAAVDQVRSLCDMAASHDAPHDFFELFKPGACTAPVRARIDQLRAIVGSIVPDERRREVDHLLWRWLRTTVVMSVDDRSGSIGERDLIGSLAAAYVPRDHRRARALLGALRILAHDRAQHAGGFDRRELLETLERARPDLCFGLAIPKGHAGEPPCAEVLRRLSERTRLAVEDAAHVSMVEGADKAWHVRLDDVYVRREADQSLLRHLHSESRLPSLVVADAGYGKTSLLWSVYGELSTNPQWDVWLLRAPALLRRSGDPSAADLEDELQRAAECGLALGRRVLIMLDTLDVHLHDDRDREHVLVLLRKLVADGARVVATCRLQEARLVPMDFDRVPLKPYSADEIHAAIRTHAAAFAPDYGSLEVDSRVLEIVDAVRWGAPLRPICQRPLTLRMLFEVYAPHEIPLEINTFALYDAFWRNRVRVDHRPGAGQPVDERDLSDAVKRIALAMLEDGSPELQQGALEVSIFTRSIRLDDLSRLCSRGVLAMGTGRVAFFHQTLFEHTAARALGETLGPVGLDALVQRIEAYPNDAFLWPVLEHALLLAARSTRRIQAWADDVLLDLLAQDAEFAMDAAIHVYCHRDEVTAEHKAAMSSVLRTAHPAVVKMFLRASENLRKDRVAELTALLEIVWARDKWDLRQMVLELLPRLAVVEPSQARGFVERNHILEFAVTPHSVRLTAPQRLAHTLVVMARSDPDWAIGAIRRTLESVEATTPSIELHTTITQLVADESAKLGPAHVADTWFGIIAGDHASEEMGELARRLARLWEIQWEATMPPVDVLVDRILTDRTNAQRAMSLAFGPYVTRHHGGRAVAAVERLLSSAPSEVLWRLRSSLASIALADPAVRQYLLTTLRSWLADAHDDSPRLRFLVFVLVEGRITPDELREALNGAGDAESDWLTSDALTVLLPTAAAAGHLSARRALYDLAAGQNRDGHLVQRCLTGLSELADHDDEALSLLVALSEAAGRVSKLVRRLATLAEVAPTRIMPWCEHLRSVAAAQIGDPDPTNRRLGTETYLQLIERRLVPVPGREALIGWLKKETDAAAQLHLLNLGLRAVRDEPVLAADLIDAVAPLEQDAHAGVREGARLLATEAASRLEDLDQAWIVALRSGFQRPVTVRRISALAHLLHRTIQRRPSVAVERLLQIFAAIPSDLSGAKRRHAARGLFAPIRELFLRAGEQDQIRLLRALPRIPQGFDRIAIVAAFSARDTELLPEIDRLLRNPEVDGEVKRVIRQNKEQRQRSVGTGSWPELADVWDRMPSGTERVGQ